MAIARDLSGGDWTVAAVIGDGALASGMAFEALNHAGHVGSDLIIVLNDNEMSISRSVGGLSSYLGSVRANSRRRRIKQATQRMVESIPVVGKAFRSLGHQLKKSLKSLLLRGMMFEELGLMYIGPIDGHNIRAVRRAVEDAKAAGGPVLVHVVTQKGKGYKPAQADPARFHGTGPFDVETGSAVPLSPGIHVSGPSFTSCFGSFMLDAAAQNPKVVAISAAMTDGTGLATFARDYPDRFFDVGIAEEHAVTFASGMASKGIRPVVAVYSTFLQRAYDQIMHDTALDSCPVVFAVDRAGIVGEDGRTHQGAFDIAFLRSVPGMVIMAPADDAELTAMFRWALSHDGPCAVRYPRAATERIYGPRQASQIELGRGEVLREGKHCTIAALGPMVQRAMEASRILSGHGVSCSVINARFAKPIDTDLILASGAKTGFIVTVEDGIATGGFGSAVAEAIAERTVTGVGLVRLGLPDRFIEHGRRDDILAGLGLDAQGIARAVREGISGGLDVCTR